MDSYSYAKQIAEYIRAKCYKRDLPEWEPASDLMGVLGQIDAMVFGMVRFVGKKRRTCCPHCFSKNLSEPYTDVFPVKGTDDPQYSGGHTEVDLVDCLDCGEMAINLYLEESEK